MFNAIKEYLFDLRVIFIIIMVIAGVILLTIVPLLFGFIFGAMAWLGLSIAARFLNKYISGLAISISKITEAKRYTIVKLPASYDIRFMEPRGFKNVLWNVYLFNLLGSFMVVRYFGVPSTDIDAFISGYLLAVFIASIIALIITPIAVNISAIETSRFRVADLDKMTMTYPAYLFYRLVKAIFSFGNLIALVIILVNSLTVAQGDVIYGFSLFIVLVLTTLSSVALGSIIATLIARTVQKDVIEGLMDIYDHSLEQHSIASEEFLNLLKTRLIEEPEEVEEKPEEVTEEEKEVGEEAKESVREDVEAEEVEGESTEGQEVSKEENE